MVGLTYIWYLFLQWLVATGKSFNTHLGYNINKHFEQRYSFITAIDMVCFTALILVPVVKTFGK